METSNIVESLASVIAKYLVGKRKNLEGRELYRTRCLTAVLSFNRAPFWAYDVYKSQNLKSPQSSWKKIKMKTISRRATANKYRKTRPLVRHKLKFLRARGDLHYGDMPQTPDMAPAVLQNEIANLRRQLNVTELERNKIMDDTTSQSDSPVWYEHHNKRITASVCKDVAKLQLSTSNHNMLNKILSTKTLQTPATIHGKTFEGVAIENYMPVMGLPPSAINKCGLIISLESGIFAASPDALVGPDCLLEVKCPFSIKDTVRHIWPDKLLWLRRTDDAKIYKLDRKHAYYYQVVIQKFVSGRKWCDFFVWTPNNHHLERIHWDSFAMHTWNSARPDLKRFWVQDLAPEIVDSRLKRGFKE